jgi:hypothetical protein
LLREKCICKRFDCGAVKDDMNDGRWTIEGGALVMADMGIALWMKWTK